MPQVVSGALEPPDGETRHPHGSVLVEIASVYAGIRGSVWNVRVFVSVPPSDCPVLVQLEHFAGCLNTRRAVLSGKSRAWACAGLFHCKSLSIQPCCYHSGDVFRLYGQ